MDDHRPSALVFGDIRHRDFRQPLSFLQERTALQIAESVGEAEQMQRGHRAASIVVLAQSRPRQITPRHIDRLHAASPVSRLLGLLGSLCEGGARSDHPWPGVMRIYWHQFALRMGRWLDAGPAACLPRTAGEADRLLADTPSNLVSTRTGKLVLIVTARSTSYQTLADACRRVGHCTTWSSPDRAMNCHDADVALFDCPAWSSRAAEQLSRLADAVSPSPVIALVGFPRFEDIARARECGAAHVISKPFLLGDLWSAIDA